VTAPPYFELPPPKPPPNLNLGYSLLALPPV
jgi:hypothetical protein